MANTTYYYDNGEYDYGNVTDEPSTDQGDNGFCSFDSVNNLGAQLSILYYFMFLFSVFGNGLVLVIIHRFEKLTTVTNIFLVNLVVSSLIFMSSLPFWGVYQQRSDWIFGKVMCKIVGSVYYMGFYSSVLFLTLLTFDRHIAVVYSLGASQVRSRRYAVISCVVVWVVSALACIRPMILHNSFYYMGKSRFCQEYHGKIDGINTKQLKKSGFYIQLIFFLIFPLVVILYCYLRIAITVLSSRIVSKFKTVRLIFVIVVMFFMCWTPYNILVLMQDKVTTCDDKRRVHYGLKITRLLAYTYFCISPIFYTFVGKKFQNYFRQLLVTRFPGLKKHVSVSQNSKDNMSTKSTRNEV